MVDVTQLISTVGFPIAMCVLMGFYLKYTHDDHREDIQRLQTQQQEREERDRETMEKLVSAVNNNTKAMERIFDLQQYLEDENNG